VALKSRHATWPFRQDTSSKSTIQQNYFFYSISLSSSAMSLQIQTDIRKPKRKLSIFLDFPDSSSFSQNLSISTPAEKKKKGSFFSQSQSTQDIQNIPIYSESTFSEDSESAIRTQKVKYSLRFRRKHSSISRNTPNYLLLYTLEPP
jgi:hypothetical protein